MVIILYYCLKVIISNGVLFGYYLLALRNNRFHEWNRWYLLTTVMLSFILPLLKIQLPFFMNDDQPVIVQGLSFLSASDIYFSKIEHTTFAFTWPVILSILYIGIVLVLLTIFIKNLIKIQTLKRLYAAESLKGIQFYNTKEPGTPFSFFKNIFWNSSIALDTEKGQQMLRHELTHVQENHSVDKVAMEFLLAVAWWNPFLHFIRKELSAIYEFIADQKASAGDDNLQYASLLLMKAMGSEQYALGNPFFHSQLKRRLMMLTTIKKQKFSYLRRVAVLPIVAFAFVLFSFKHTKQSTSNSTLLKKQNILAVSDNDETIPVHGFYQDSAKKRADSKTDNKLIDESTVYTKVEEPASFPGGIDGWRHYLEKSLQYPEAAQKHNTQGAVRVQMTVNADGNVSDVKAINDPGDGLGKEAERVIKKGPKWVPAKQNHQEVAYRFVQTITFQLQ